MPYIDPQELLLLRLEAMRSVLKNDAGFTYRSICRWYSQAYNTPLHEVGTPTGVVSMEEVLQTFYEARYAEMDDAKKEAELVGLPSDPRGRSGGSPEVRHHRGRELDVRAQCRGSRSARRRRRNAWRKSRCASVRPLPVKGMLSSCPSKRVLPQANIGDGSLPAPQPLRPAMTPPPKAPQELLIPTSLPEGVKVVFMTDEEMEREASCMDPFSIEKGTAGFPKKPAI